MNIDEFITNMAEQFNDMDSALITPDSEFKALEEWSSLVALSLIAMIDEEYDVVLKGDDIRNSSTVQQLFDLVKEKQ